MRKRTSNKTLLIGGVAALVILGGGGLGQMAINYGYNRWQDDVMISTVVAIIIIIVGCNRLVERRYAEVFE